MWPLLWRSCDNHGSVEDHVSTNFELPFVWDLVRIVIVCSWIFTGLIKIYIYQARIVCCYVSWFSFLRSISPSSKQQNRADIKSTLDINIQFELNLKWILPTRWWSFVLMLWGSSNVSSANGEYVTGLLVNTSPPIEKKVLSSLNTAIPCVNWFCKRKWQRGKFEYLWTRTRFLWNLFCCFSSQLIRDCLDRNFV